MHSRQWALITAMAFVLAPPWTSRASSEVIQFVSPPDDDQLACQPSAYFMNLGPGLSDQLCKGCPPQEEPFVHRPGRGSGIGTRFLRVTLLRVERSYSVSVEEMFSSGIGSRRESLVKFQVYDFHASLGVDWLFTPTNVEWIDFRTFELVDTVPRRGIGIRFVRFTQIATGEFELVAGIRD